MEKVLDCDGLLFPTTTDILPSSSSTTELDQGARAIQLRQNADLDSGELGAIAAVGHNNNLTGEEGAIATAVAGDYDSNELEEFLRGMMIQTTPNIPFQHPRPGAMAPNYVPSSVPHGSNNLFQTPYYHHHVSAEDEIQFFAVI